MGEAKARGTYEQRKAHPKDPASVPAFTRTFPRSATTAGPSEKMLLWKAIANMPIVRRFTSKRARREAERFARDQRRKAKANANPIPLPDRVALPLGSGD